MYTTSNWTSASSPFYNPFENVRGWLMLPNEMYTLTISANQTLRVKQSHLALANGNGDVLFPFAPGGVVGVRKDRIRYQVMSLLDGTRTVRDIYDALQLKGYSGDLDDILKVVQRLASEKLLESCDGQQQDDEDRYNRQRLFMGSFAENGRQFSTDVQSKLETARVAIIGIGGIGSHVLLSLQAMGIGKLIIVDGDRVALSNLNRQCFYSERDAGKNKIDVLREKCSEYNSAIQYEFQHRNLGSTADFIDIIKDCDLAIMTADTPRDDIFSWSHQAAMETGTPVLYSLGAFLNSICAGPLYIPGKTNCFHCFHPYTAFSYFPLQFQHVNLAYQHGSFMPHIATTGQIMALEAVKHLTGFQKCRLYNHIVRIDFDTYTTESTPGPASKCPRCNPNRAEMSSAG